MLDLPPERARLGAGGILAFSKICTHAGCAINLYRYPLSRADLAEPGARLPLPLLDLRRRRRAASASSAPPGAPCRSCRSTSTTQGRLIAAGDMSGPIGPSWLGGAQDVIRSRAPLPRRAHRLGAGAPQAALRYVFPDHWTFLFGEIALYSFVVLIGTGVFLTLFFEPCLAETTYDGSYAPLQGAEMSDAYRLGAPTSRSTSTAGC